MNSEATDAGGGAGGGGGGEGAEGKGGDDEAVAFSAEYVEVTAMAKQTAFDVNTSRCSDGFPPIFFAVGASSWEAPAHEDCLVLVLGLPDVDVNLQDEQHGQTALFFAAYVALKVLKTNRIASALVVTRSKSVAAILNVNSFLFNLHTPQNL